MRLKEIEELVFLSAAERSQQEYLKLHLMRRPDILFWQSPSESDFSAAFKQIRGYLDCEPALIELLERHFITTCLLFRPCLPEWAASQIYRLMSPDRHLHPLTFKQALAGRWLSAPILLVKDSREADIRHLVMGMIPGLKNRHTDWAAQVMERETLEAVSDAIAAAGELTGDDQDSGIFFYPLVMQSDSVRIQGRSLGLPAGLGAAALMTKHELPEEIAASGDIRPGGKIASVAGVRQKCQCIRDRFRIFMHPADGASPAPNAAMILLPVKTLRQAWMVARLYSRENADRLALFSAMTEDASILIANFEAVPYEWLINAFDNGDLDAVLKKIPSSPLLFSSLVDRFEAMVKKGQNETADAVSRFLHPDDLPDMAAIAPLSAFRWAGVNLCKSNHRGRTARSRFWGDAARQLMGEALKADLHSVTDFFNYLFVARHNRYDFRPELPGDLTELLECLEEQYACQCHFGCRVYPALGALYGTVSQNYAFCGPDFLKTAIEYSQKARNALGENTVPELMPEWLRQYNYLSYAYLDAGAAHLPAARRSFCRYLGIENMEMLRNRFSCFTRWEHALTARLLAEDSENAASVYAAWCRRHLKRLPEKEHPWQLWLFNMGRIARQSGNRDEAAQRFRQSMDFCLSEDFGPAVQVMALLPLSSLYEMDCLPVDEMKRSQIKVIEAAQELTQKHFSSLGEQNFEEVLAAVNREPGKWFPFNYR